MFECRACSLRCIRAIAGDGIHASQTVPRRTLLQPRIIHRGIGSVPTAFDTSLPSSVQDDIIIPGNESLEQKSVKSGKYAIPPAEEKALRTELKYLPDKLKLAEHVRYTLRCNAPEKALNLCRLASKQQSVVVSWNHCVDWHVKNGKVDAAIKIYNEMKKRAQFPDSYTYTLLLRGLAKPAHDSRYVKEGNVTKAMNIYNSMSSTTSRVAPNLRHTNAVLDVCTTCNDIDTLWAVVAKLPTDGPGSPDHVTYAIILNALRHNAFGKDADDMYMESVSRLRTKAVMEGRAIWRDVIKKWRAGQVQIDEKLVLAMGKLLLFSGRMSDWDDILNLVEQTMNIERQIPPLGAPGRHTEHVPPDHNLREPDPEEDDEGYKDTPTTKTFLPVFSPPERRTSPLIWTQPGTSTLALLIEACAVMRTPKTAILYWDLLTSDPYNLAPNLQIFHAQLRLCSKNRASAKAVEIVTQQMPKASVVGNSATFRIAMSTCGRNKNSPGALAQARSLVDEMERTLPDPDARVLRQYLDLAMGSDGGRKLVDALNRLDPLVHNLRSRMTYGADRTGDMRPEEHLKDKEDILKLFRAMIGAYDAVRFRGLVPRDELSHWHGRRYQLDSFIGRAKFNVDQLRERLEKKAREKENELSDGTEQGWIRKHDARGERLQTSKEISVLRAWEEKRKRRGEESAAEQEMAE